MKDLERERETDIIDFLEGSYKEDVGKYRWNKGIGVSGSGNLSFKIETKIMNNCLGGELLINLIFS